MRVELWYSHSRPHTHGSSFEARHLVLPMSLDSASVVTARLGELGLSSVQAKFVELGWITHALFAFATSYTPAGLEEVFERHGIRNARVVSRPPRGINHEGPFARVLEGDVGAGSPCRRSCPSSPRDADEAWDKTGRSHVAPVRCRDGNCVTRPCLLASVGPTPRENSTRSDLPKKEKDQQVVHTTVQANKEIIAKTSGHSIQPLSTVSPLRFLQ